MYFLAKFVWGRAAGFISALVYIYTPYRLVNILVRGNIGESTSFAFIPLFFLGIYFIYKGRRWLGIIIASLALSALILSHFMILFLLLLPGFLYILYFGNHPKAKISYLLSVFGVLLISFLVSAFYLLPAFIYKPLTKFDGIAHDLYLNQFTPLKKLIYSPWGFGAITQSEEMSRQVGPLIWALLILAIIIHLLEFFRKKRHSLYYGLGSILILTMLFSIYMMMNISRPIWKFLEPISPVDIPWRFLAVTTFTGSLLAGFAINYISRWKYIYYAIILLLVLALAYTNRNYLRINQETHFPLSLYISSELTTNAYNEYQARWVNENAALEKRPVVQIKNAAVENIYQKSNKISFSYKAKENNLATIHHMYFPGWSAKIDGKDSDIQKSGIGGMEIKVPKGSHQVVLKYSSTLPMVLGNLLTIFSLVILIGFVIKKIIFRPNYV